MARKHENLGKKTKSYREKEDLVEGKAIYYLFGRKTKNVKNYLYICKDWEGRNKKFYINKIKIMTRENTLDKILARKLKTLTRPNLDNK